MCEDVGRGSAAGEHLHRGARDPREPALWTGSGHPESWTGSWRFPARMSGGPGAASGVGPGGQRGSSGRSGRVVHRVSPTVWIHFSLPVCTIQFISPKKSKLMDITKTQFTWVMIYTTSSFWLTSVSLTTTDIIWPWLLHRSLFWSVWWFK